MSDLLILIASIYAIITYIIGTIIMIYWIKEKNVIKKGDEFFLLICFLICPITIPWLFYEFLKDV